MSPLPWPLIGRTRHTAPAPAAPAPLPVPRTPAHARPTEPAKRPAWTPPEPGPTATPYPALGDPTPPGAPLWIHAEAATLAALAEAGGDLTAHRTVHQETR